MPTRDPAESTLLEPILGLFDAGRYRVHLEVKLGQRKIDVVCVDPEQPQWVGVELKVRDWRGALRQATINHILVDRSYVALWHRYVPLALAHRHIFEQYRVGLIEIGPEGVYHRLDFESLPPTVGRQRHQELIASQVHQG